MNKIIVVVGMCGVGKTVACDYLESLGLERIYFGAITFEKLQEAGLEDSPENERMMREKCVLKVVWEYLQLLIFLS